MKKANFNTLKNLPVPEGWMEKALAIPEAEEKKAVVPPWRRKGAAALAASILLVTAVGAALFLSIGRSPVTVKPSATEATLAAVTETVGDPTAPSEQTSEAPSAAATEAFIPTASTEPTTPSARNGTAPSQAPTAKPTVPAAKPTAPAENPTVPAIAPTQPSTTAPTQATIWEPPTEPPTPTATPWDQPTEVTWEHPTSAPTEAPTRLRTVVTTIPRGSLPPDKKVYCRIELPDGTVLGDYDLFAKEREMLEYGSHLYSYNVYRRISEPIYEGVSLVCYIYDSSGNILTENYYLDYY